MGQSFFVHASGAPVLTMDNSVRLHNAQPFWKSNEVIPDLLRIQASANGASDETIVRFSDSASLNFDSDRDAYKLSGGENAPSLCSVTPDETELSINALPYNSQDVIVPLNFSLNANAQVSFTASGMESFTSGTPIYLEDLLLNKVIDLRNNPVYSFSNAIGNNQSRFRLRFMGITATLEQPESGRGKVFVSQGKIYLDLPDMQQNEARVDLSDVLGRSLGSRSVRLDGILSLPAPPMEGVCIVRVTSGNKTFSSRLLIP